MNNSQDYVLVLGPQSDDSVNLQALLEPLRCSIVIVSSADQVMARFNDAPPYLMILIGNHHDWSPSFMSRLRHIADAVGSTILALTDFNAPSWPLQDEKFLFDGFLVKPISQEVLVSVIYSARARQAFWAAS